jgi:demethoxyubiquinone hydroxylase (CLK1/Coq7/Cat5 family)
VNNAKFIRQLQKAHSGEIGAYFAYGGHWKSVKDPGQRMMIRFIQDEEREHIRTLDLMLYLLKATPDFKRDKIFRLIGKTLGFLCHVTGYFMPMWGAMFIEKIGVANYSELAREAVKLHYYQMADTLIEMHGVELDHENYFRKQL